MVELWVRVVWWSRFQGGQWGPDVPEAVDAEGNGLGYPAASYEFHWPRDISRTKPPRGQTGRFVTPLEDPSPHGGDPIVTAGRIIVSEADARAIRTAVKEVQPSERDRALVEACRVTRRGGERHMDSAEARATFREIETRLGGRADRADVLNEALAEAARRGLGLGDADAIRQERNLSSGAMRR